MRLHAAKALATLLVLTAATSQTFAGNTQVVPTTTLSAETGNNTSAADTFAGQPNGNLAAGNVSKVPISNWLYDGATTKTYVHFMAWFGGTNHANVGYRSDDPVQVQRQVTDLISRGISGAIIDWYGSPTNSSQQREDDTTYYMMREAESRGGQFQFAINYDSGALKTCSKTVGCDVTQKAINDLNYAYNRYVISPAYLTWGGRPVIHFFGTEAYALDWTRIRSGVPGNPLFIFRNAGGFTKAQSNGAFSWVAPETVSSTDLMALNYLTNFYTTSLSYPSALTTASAYKGFNDSIASWTSGRVIGQQCGQTWLATLAKMNSYFAASRQVPMLQLVTWNDYEEGTALEVGIDNCLSVSAAMSGSVLSWSAAGNENTLDHYTIFISTDGQSLMSLGDVPVAQHSVDLSGFGFAPANYTLYVKAIGKPMFRNQMSAAVSYAIANQPPTVSLTLSRSSGIAPVSVTATATASDSDGSVAASSIDFGDGTVVNGTSASHTYSVPGTYTVTAIATDNMGATARQSATVSVAANQPPVASLSVAPASGTAPVTVTASLANSSDADGRIASAAINFGDGTTVSGMTASHTFSTAGTYVITGTVTDDRGASASSSASVTVSAPVVVKPTVAISAPLNNATVKTTFGVVAGAKAGTYAVTTMQIYVDGVLAYKVNAAAINTSLTLAVGTHRLTVKAWDSAGNNSMQSLSVNVVANKAPTAALTVTPTSGNAPVVVTASTAGSSDSDGSIVKTTINFGDGTFASSATASHTYSAAGIYAVTATVTDNNGASASVSRTVTVSATANVKVTSPTTNSTSTGSVRVTASGYSPAGVTAMKVYVDSVAKYSTTAASVDTMLGLTAGTHTITVQQWDKAGVVTKAAPVTVTVSSLSTTRTSRLENITGGTLTTASAAEDANTIEAVVRPDRSAR